MTADLIKRMCTDETASLPSMAVVAAHPDDEVIGAGGRFAGLRGCRFIHVTDGAPRSMHDALAAGFTIREEYAKARRCELLSALGLAGIGPAQCLEMGIADQEASLHLLKLSYDLADLFSGMRPEMVLTHPYEGGHPDHDATAFAVYTACRLLEKAGITPPGLVEFTSYHSDGRGGMRTFEFIPFEGCSVTTVVLSESERRLKQRMLACFGLQRRVLDAFPVGIERFRPAPCYDFTLPPHEGRLYYEQFDWGVAGERWRGLVRSALEILEVEETVWH